MAYVLVRNSTVVEVVQNDPYILFVPGYAAQFVAAPDGVQPGWVVSNGQYSAPAVDLNEVKIRHWEAIKAERDRRTQQGGFPVNGKWYHSDTFSRTQHLGLVMMGANVPAINWKTMDGTFQPMTQSLANQIFAAAAASDMAIFQRAEALKVVMEADPLQFNLTAQTWPLTFQG